MTEPASITELSKTELEALLADARETAETPKPTHSALAIVDGRPHLHVVTPTVNTNTPTVNTADKTDTDTDTDTNLATEERLKVQEELNAYREAMEKEFERQQQLSPESLEEQLTSFFKSQVPMAAGNIAWLAMCASNEGVRLSASKYIIEQGREEAKCQQHPLTDLINRIAPDPKEG